jgi:hypothetical protein
MPAARPKCETPGADYWVDKYVGEATVGNRNRIGSKLAAMLLSEGLTLNEASYYMRQYARSVNNPSEPYTEREALSTLRYVYENYRRMPPAIIEPKPYFVRRSA